MALLKINLSPTRETLRQFGFVALAGFAILAGLAYMQWLAFTYLTDSATRPTSIALAVVALLCGLLAVAAPGALRPLYVALSVIAFPIGYAISYAVMAVIFYGVLTPVGIVFRLIGRDAMNRKFDANASTYWIRRTPPVGAKRYFRQF